MRRQPSSPPSAARRWGGRGLPDERAAEQEVFNAAQITQDLCLHGENFYSMLEHLLGFLYVVVFLQLRTSLSSSTSLAVLLTLIQHIFIDTEPEPPKLICRSTVEYTLNEYSCVWRWWWGWRWGSVRWKCDVMLINGWLVPEANESLSVVVHGWSIQWQAGRQLAAPMLRKNQDTKECFFRCCLMRCFCCSSTETQIFTKAVEA